MSYSYIERYRILCPSCGASISLDYSKCPKCRAKVRMEKRSRWKFRLIFSVIMCAALILFASYVCWRGGIGSVISDFAGMIRTELNSAKSDISDTLAFVFETGQEEPGPETAGGIQGAAEHNSYSTYANEESIEFENIYSEYSLMMKNSTPLLIDEMTREVREKETGFSESAKICSEKIKKLSELSVEGTAKMSEQIKKATKEKYELYTEWSAKLNEVYKDESDKIMEAFSTIISESEGYAL